MEEQQLRVELTNPTLLACMLHALSTEGEEIMGLLLGDVDQAAGVVRIWMAYPQIRTDRRQDRVETSPEQMARCSAHAERLSQMTGVTTRVVGWYHSHPHITVLPSHVDLRTQALYQMLSPHFVGLILSVFNADPTSHTNTLQVTAFQAAPSSALDLQPLSSADLRGLDAPLQEALQASAAGAAEVAAGGFIRREIPLQVVAAHGSHEQALYDINTVNRTLYKEEQDSYHSAVAAAAAAATAAINSLSLSQNSTSPTNPTSTSSSQLFNTSSQTMATAAGNPHAATAAKQRPGATAATATTATGGVGVTGGAAAADGAARSATAIATAAATALSQLQHAGSYQQTLCRLVDTVLAPSINMLQGREREHAMQLQQLRDANAQLQAQVS